MSTATNGRAREHRVTRHMEKAGWLKVMRSAGSKGVADLFLVHPFHGTALVQVGTGSKFIGPDDRDKFVTIAEACGALPLLASCAPGVPPVFWRVTRDTASKWERW
jgi:Holliday junction resolvase